MTQGYFVFSCLVSIGTSIGKTDLRMNARLLLYEGTLQASMYPDKVLLRVFKKFCYPNLFYVCQSSGEPLNAIDQRGSPSIHHNAGGSQCHQRMSLSCEIVAFYVIVVGIVFVRIVVVRILVLAFFRFRSRSFSERLVGMRW